MVGSGALWDVWPKINGIIFGGVLVGGIIYNYKHALGRISFSNLPELDPLISLSCSSSDLSSIFPVIFSGSMGFSLE